MPSDKHNSRTARVNYELDFFTNQYCFVPRCAFHLPQQLQCLHHGTTLIPPILSSQPHKVTICGRHIMGSVRDIKITEALLILCYEASLEIEALWLSCIDTWNVYFTSVLSIFCNGWMDCRNTFHTVLCLYCCITDRT